MNRPSPPPCAAKPQSEALTRLEQIRAIFSNRGNAVTGKMDASQRISLAEGGCLLPPHISVQETLQDVVADQAGNAFQIYPYNPVDHDFLAAIDDYFRNRCEIPLGENTGIMFGFGSSHIFDAVLSTICEPGDVIVMPTPYYHLYADWPTKWNATADFIPTRREDGYKLTAPLLEQWLDAPGNRQRKIKCLQITNPLITGALYTKTEMESLAAVIRNRGIYVFCDEVFRDSEFTDGKTVSLASLPGMTDCVITANSGSKTRGSADFRLGWACGPQAVIAGAIRYMERTITEIPMYLQRIGTAILKTPQSYLDEARREYETRARLVHSLTQETNIRLNRHFGTAGISYIDIPVTPESGHYMALNFDSLSGFTMPCGTCIQDGKTLTSLFYDPPQNESGMEDGIIFSPGHSRGHDDLTMYIAFAQLGYEYVNEALQDYTSFRLYRNQIVKSAGKPVDDDTIRATASLLGLAFAQAASPDLEPACEAGRDMLRECFRRMENTIKTLTPPPDFTARRQPGTAYKHDIA